jgi:hypothetical protein
LCVRELTVTEKWRDAQFAGFAIDEDDDRGRGPMRLAWRQLSITAIVLVFGLTLPPVSVRGDDSVTVQLTVDASGAADDQLSYQWRATDGQIVHPKSKTTDWILQNGPGIHFAYVLVSNGKGGYTEGRIAVNTDDNPTTTVRPRDQYPEATSRIFNKSADDGKTSQGFFQPDLTTPDLSLPLDDGQGTITGQLLLGDKSVCGKRIPFFGVDVTARVQLRDNNNTFLSETVLNPYAFGEFTLKDVPGGTKLFAICEGATQTFTNVIRNPGFSGGPVNSLIMNGTTQPEVKSMSATVKSMSATQNGKNVGMFPVLPTPAHGTLPSDFFGRQDYNVLGTPRFLSFKGLDTRRGGCEYYKAIGAVHDCDAAGNFVGAVLNFKDWRKSVRIGEFKQTTNPLVNEPQTIFINKTDLNLTRDHHSIAYGMDSQGKQQLAAYVCNHPGAAPDPNTDPTGLFPAQSDIDTAIEKVLNVDAAHPQGRNLVACVAMDRSSDIVDVNGLVTRNHVGEPFTRFLIFGPNGDLLPSVNLDGNGEKFVPGTCVACHGGASYFAIANDTLTEPAPSAAIFGGFPERVTALGFPESGNPSTSGNATPNLESYFLPYDVGNFLFSSKHPNTINDMQLQLAISQLNSNALSVDQDIALQNTRLYHNPSPDPIAFIDLLERWYHGDIIFDEKGPPGVREGSPYGDDADKFYSNVVARSCRSCHIAMDGANFETKDPVNTPFFRNLVCGGGTPGNDPASSYMMPNAQVTFDRFWLSDRTNVPGQPSGTFNQPDALRKHAMPMLTLDDCKNP